jgi:anti-sigma regulatory factor (Ser/Thr protein kinase)
VTSAQARDRRHEPLAGQWPPGPARWPAAGNCCSTVLAPAGAAARAAREFTAAVLRGWQLEPLVQDAVLIASELAANAIRHAHPAAGEPGSLSELTWWHEGHQLTCVVTDACGRPPVLAPPDPTAESGRGLQIVDAVAAAWGWTPLGSHAKAVWAALWLPR